MNSIIGAVFPISAKHASRIFDEGRTVFVKYTKFNKFDKNARIIFYISKEKRIMGEGVIENVAKMAPNDVWSKYGTNVFLNADEYKRYTSWSSAAKKNRTSAEITVFILKKIRKYKQSLSFHNIGPSGCYIAVEDYNKLIG